MENFGSSAEQQDYKKSSRNQKTPIIMEKMNDNQTHS